MNTSKSSVNSSNSWLSRQSVKHDPGIIVTHGITQNNVTIRTGSRRPTFKTEDTNFTYMGTGWIS